MREIICRAKRIDNNKFVYGYYYHSAINGRHYISDLSKSEATEIDRETLGQYVGLDDKTNRKIYDDDICSDSVGDVVQVLWSEKHQWGCKIIKGHILSIGLIFPLWQWDRCEENGNRQLTIIGNVHENPELLEVAK
jgi:hypothetical protein